MNQVFTLSDEYNSIIEMLEKTPQSMFITGKAGTGKSTLLQLFRNTTRKKVVVLAPTGVAALNVQGQTIHSFFGFPPKPIEKFDIKKRSLLVKLCKNIDTLIIDEISMVRADLLDNIDYFLRLHRDNPKPFGGLQMVFFGDMFQLPPVVASEEEKLLFKTRYESPYFFDSEVFKDGFEMEMVELSKIYRQEERHFIRLLDAVRTNQIDYDDLEDLNVRHIPQFASEEYYITLTSRNNIADNINKTELDKINNSEFAYLATVEGTFDARVFPTEPILKLKEGAQVMFIKNDNQDKLFVNGTIGKVISLTNDEIKVVVEEKNAPQRLIKVEKQQWEILKYKLDDGNGKIQTEVLGTFKQFPLKLAWAITIHKSQGKTFDRVIVDLGAGGAFEHGQVYVALSRCRTLGGIVLRHKLKPKDILTDERIVQFYETNF